MRLGQLTLPAVCCSSRRFRGGSPRDQARGHRLQRAADQLARALHRQPRCVRCQPSRLPMRFLTPLANRCDQADAGWRQGPHWRQRQQRRERHAGRFCSSSAIFLSRLRTKQGLQFQDSAHMDVLEALVSGLDNEGRYFALNAIANQLRYPNSHTYFFSCGLLYLFLQVRSLASSRLPVRSSLVNGLSQYDALHRASRRSSWSRSRAYCWSV